MGEDSWDIYVQLIEKYVTGTIDENELERETAKEFLMSDHRAKKKLRRLTEKMVKDKLEADKRSTENESTVGGDV
jgi:dephospho-CoA kinase